MRKKNKPTTKYPSQDRRVLYITPSTHQKVVAYCRKNGFKVYFWVDKTLANSITAIDTHCDIKELGTCNNCED